MFLKITDPWSSEEKNVFSRGIQYGDVPNYVPGYLLLKTIRPFANDREAKALYCQVSGLTLDFVFNANRTQLLRAASNLNYPGLATDTDIRNWLLSFIRGDSPGENDAAASRGKNATAPIVL